MGREIRRVPANWQHPRHEYGERQGQFKPLHDQSYDDACREWWQRACRWHNGEVDASDAKYVAQYPWFWQWGGNPPHKDGYREAFKNEATHYQIYETVSEGTPVSPVFATEAEMIEWMTQPIDRSSEYNRGADWQCMQGMTREQAEQFVHNGGSVSMIVSDGVLHAGHRFASRE